jgi:hypothetical protein
MIWRDLQKQFEPDGSLRDIYVSDCDPDLWSTFLRALENSEFPHFFSHGGECLEKSVYSLEEVLTLRETDPVLLQIKAGPEVCINCHFFDGDELELDLDPREIIVKENFLHLLGFLKWLSRELMRTVRVTYENSPKHVILTVKNGKAQPAAERGAEDRAQKKRTDLF